MKAGEGKWGKKTKRRSEELMDWSIFRRRAKDSRGQTRLLCCCGGRFAPGRQTSAALPSEERHVEVTEVRPLERTRTANQLP